MALATPPAQVLEFVMDVEPHLGIEQVRHQPGAEGCSRAHRLYAIP